MQPIEPDPQFLNAVESDFFIPIFLKISHIADVLRIRKGVSGALTLASEVGTSIGCLLIFLHLPRQGCIYLCGLKTMIVIKTYFNTSNTNNIFLKKINSDFSHKTYL